MAHLFSQIDSGAVDRRVDLLTQPYTITLLQSVSGQTQPVSVINTSQRSNCKGKFLVSFPHRLYKRFRGKTVVFFPFYLYRHAVLFKKSRQFSCHTRTPRKQKRSSSA